MAKVDRRELQLKFRLGITRRMTKSDAMRKLKRAVRSGLVPEGIVIHWAQFNHKKPEEGHYREGKRLSGGDLDSLRLWYDLLVAGNVEANKVG